MIWSINCVDLSYISRLKYKLVAAGLKNEESTEELETCIFSNGQ